MKLFSLLTVLLFATTGLAQEDDRVPQLPERAFLSRVPAPGAAPGGAAGPRHDQLKPANCRGPITHVQDVGFEGLKWTNYNFSNPGGGGEGGRFDRTPVLSTTVRLAAGTCLDAHFSALVGSKQTYGFVSSITMFQVTLTPTGSVAPRHMYGHYETPYGINAPVVALEAERDVDEFSANFFQRVGTAAGDVAPGSYRVDVWWSGGPIGGGGAIGAAFVLKLYLR